MTVNQNIFFLSFPNKKNIQYNLSNTRKPWVEKESKICNNQEEIDADYYKACSDFRDHYLHICLDVWFAFLKNDPQGRLICSSAFPDIEDTCQVLKKTKPILVKRISGEFWAEKLTRLQAQWPQKLTFATVRFVKFWLPRAIWRGATRLDC